MKYKTKHCCDQMGYHLQEGDLPLAYSPRDRMYYIPLKRLRGGGIQALDFCPWCGTNLPKRLRQEFLDTLEKEYNLVLDYDEAKKAPKEFQSEEWWIKRGL